MAIHLKRSDYVGFRKCSISNGADDTDNMLWNGSERNGGVRSECKMKAFTVKRETVTLRSNGR
jgi:hypothetical protein